MAVKSIPQAAESLVQAHERRYDVALVCTPGELLAKPWLAHGRNVILIDTLRNSTSITVALAAGASDVVLYGKAEESLALIRRHADEYSGTKLFAGEIEGRPIPGFNLSNSPRDFTPDRVHGQRIFYSSTNGGSALRQVLELCDMGVFFACILNGQAVGEAIARKRIGSPLLFVCSGFRGGFSFEDFVTGGQVLLAARSLNPDLGLFDDGASTAMDNASAWFDAKGQVREPDLLRVRLEECRCGSVLVLMNQAPDIEAAIVGKGLPSAVLEEARKCIPVLDRSESIPRIVHSDIGRQLKGWWEAGSVDLSATSAYLNEYGQLRQH